MRINNKGFTMVELLAVIVIMGIIMVLGLSILTSTIDRSRKKEYISDASKMVSRAEYIMKAKSGSIDKPDNGSAIVMSLKYLDDGSFTSAPYGGEYNFDSSFVVIIGNGNDLEYQVMLVENVPKGGHFGINLSSIDNLEIANVEAIEDTDLCTVSSGNISGCLSDYSIENYYHEQ